MRHDVLIIWGHGLPDLDGVMEIVRATPGFKIRRLLLRDIDDMPRFVRSVYNFDYAPYRHLIGKTKYLLSVPPRAAFIVLENAQPEEHTVGTGRFAHTECRHMTALKRAIRERFNPVVDGQPSEQHIVHGTDHVGQTLATLNLLGYRRIDELIRDRPAILETPDHLPPRKQWTLQRVEVSRVYARVANAPGEQPAHRVVPIGQTPHALYLAGERGSYEQYWRSHRGGRLQEHHAPQAFDRLAEQFDYLGEGHPDSVLLLEPLDDERYVLLDGVHRAAILQSKGVTGFIAAVAGQDAKPVATETVAAPIDLLQVFDQTETGDFAVMKTLPAGTLEPGSDIDLLCRDKAALGKQLMRSCRPMIDAGYTIRLRELAETDQAHLDILQGDRIALRLDLHEGLGAYQQVPIKETFGVKPDGGQIDAVSGATVTSRGVCAAVTASSAVYLRLKDEVIKKL